MDKKVFENEVDLLVSRIGQLTDLCTRLKEENVSLKTSQESLRTEKAAILEKNNMAKSRVEAMIRRLKSMEQN